MKMVENFYNTCVKIALQKFVIMRDFTLLDYRFCFVFFAILAVASSNDVCEKGQSCSPDGPAIRFPFWLRDKQPVDCGYPGFNLYCDNSSRTVLKLPSSPLKLFVEHISYTSHIIQVYYQESCLPKLIRNLNVSTVFPFQFSSWDQFTLFNCSSSSNRSTTWSYYLGFDINCLDSPGYHVHATRSNEALNTLPSLELCTKLYSTWGSAEFFGRDTRIQLRWSLAKCEECEKNGGICRLKSGTNDEIDCKVNPDWDSTKKKLITACEVIGPLILFLAILTGYYIYSSNKMYRENQVRIKKFLEDYSAMKPTRYTYMDLKRITNNFKEQLGEGGYGTVFKGKISDEILVAVKLLNDSSTTKGEEFVNEVATMGRIHHVNVVRLIGFCADGFRRALIYEFIPKGSLDKFILTRNEMNTELDWDKKQEIALGIARGIEYLHQGCEQRILHFDIKPHNVLLDDNFTPKITDFGLAKLCEKGKTAVSMTAARGTMGYMAPEVYSRQFGYNVSYKSDIYSFGMLLLEMVGRTKNLDERERVNFPELIYRNLVRDTGTREGGGIQYEKGEGNRSICRKLGVVGLWCIQWNPMDRPSITYVLQMLEGNGENLNLPPNSFTSSRNDATLHSKAIDSVLEIISES